MVEKKLCLICGSEAKEYSSANPVLHPIMCPICGKYTWNSIEASKMNKNHLGAYMVYNGFRENDDRDYFIISHEGKDLMEQAGKQQRYSVCLTAQMVEIWYPKTFAEKIDYILQYLNSHIYHIGEELSLKKEVLHGALFVERYDWENERYVERTPRELEIQTTYMIKCLEESGYIKRRERWDGPEEERPLTLTPKGYARVDELLKNTSNGKKVLVAMSFNNTEALREAIRKGIEAAGYIADYIDEAQHNGFITPELLKHIRDSKFVVVDLTHQNNGAYFEEGYAMGLGKPVIQLCKKGIQLHFDIAQKNTIIWEVENDIPERLKNRIKATID